MGGSPHGPLGGPPDVAEVENGPTAGRLARPRATGAILDICSTNTGLIGFDVETARRFVRPELLRLLKRGTQTTANDEQFAIAA